MHARCQRPRRHGGRSMILQCPLMESVGRSACDLPFGLDFKMLPEQCWPMGGAAPYHLCPGLSCGCAFASVRFHWARPNGAGAMVGGCAKETTINASRN